MLVISNKLLLLAALGVANSNNGFSSTPRPRNLYSELAKLSSQVGVTSTPTELNFGNQIKIINNYSDSSVTILAPVLSDLNGKRVSLLNFNKDVESVKVLSANMPNFARVVKLLELHQSKYK